MDRRLLILNASNYALNVIYPYAFVQVSAIARRAGFDTIRQDLLTHAKATWPRLISELVAQHRPTLIGVHLRQCDSQFIEEYDSLNFPHKERVGYYPLEDTKDLITSIRKTTDTPIVVGGFGLTNAPAEIFTYLNPDFAIDGEPEDFFARFDEVLSSDTPDRIPVRNLIHRHNGVVHHGGRTFFDPNPDTEYTLAVFHDLVRFYAEVGRSVSVGKLGEVDVPVEISRGCPYSCAFCTEPHVKGKRTRYRDLEVVMEELRFLSAQGVRSVWFVCSELNIGNSDFAIELAERMIQFNEERPGREIVWKAYSLPRPVIAEQDWKVLARSGYIPGWNGVTSFSDTNLKRMKVPYRTRDAVRYLNSVSDLRPSIRQRTGSDILKIELFLGNARSDVATVRDSLRAIHTHSLFDQFEHKEIIRGTRIYRSTHPALGLPEKTPEHMFGRASDRKRYLFPTYVYPPALLEHFGDTTRLLEFFEFVENTVCRPVNQLGTLAAHRVFRDHISADLLGKLLSSNPRYLVFAKALEQRFQAISLSDDVESGRFEKTVLSRACDVLTLSYETVLDDFLSGSQETASLEEAVAEVILRAVWDMSPGLFDRLLRAFDLEPDRYEPVDYSQYEIISAVFSKVGTREEFRKEILPSFATKERCEAEFGFEWLLARHRIDLRADFRPFFVEASVPAARPQT